MANSIGAYAQGGQNEIGAYEYAAAAPPASEISGTVERVREIEIAAEID